MEAMACLAHHWAGSDDVLLAEFYVLGPSMLLAGLPAGWLLVRTCGGCRACVIKGALPWLDEIWRICRGGDVAAKAEVESIRLR